MTAPTIFETCRPRADVLSGAVADADFAVDMASVVWLVAKNGRRAVGGDGERSSAKQESRQLEADSTWTRWSRTTS